MAPQRNISIDPNTVNLISAQQVACYKWQTRIMGMWSVTGQWLCGNVVPCARVRLACDYLESLGFTWHQTLPSMTQRLDLALLAVCGPSCGLASSRKSARFEKGLRSSAFSANEVRLHNLPKSMIFISLVDVLSAHCAREFLPRPPHGPPDPQHNGWWSTSPDAPHNL